MRTIRNCNVCVVGGAGFIGSHLVNHLVEDRDCFVHVVDNLVAGRREFLHPDADFHHHDITRSEDYLRKLFVREKIQYVLNYAAYPYVPDSFSRPLHVFDVNANGAIKVINAAQEAGCEAILQVSSAELYGQGQGEWEPDDLPGDEKYTPTKIGEGAAVAPHSTYGAAKAAVDYYCQSAWRERRTPVITLRQFNCVGERETHPYVLPEIISQLARQQLPKLVIEYGGECGTGTVKLGNNSFRDFMYAGDAVRIAVELLERGQFGEVYNLGSEEGVKVYDLAKLVGKVMGFAEVRVEVDDTRKRPWEIWHLQSDNGKIKDAISGAKYGMNSPLFRVTPLEEAVRRTVAYYKQSGRKWVWE